MDDAQLLQDLEELLRDMPPADKLGGCTPENMQWFGRARAIIGQWDGIKSVFFGGNVETWFTGGHTSDRAYVAIMTVLYEARTDLKMKTGGPTSVAARSISPA
jgi:hypothetical protein